MTQFSLPTPPAGAAPAPDLSFEAPPAPRSASAPGAPPRPDPPPSSPTPPGQGQGQEDVVVESKPRTQKPRRYKVIFHNDDFTTMEFVVEVLRSFFHKNDAEAVHIMLTVHKKGKACAGIYTREVAETKVTEVIKHARKHGMPLLLTSEPE